MRNKKQENERDVSFEFNTALPVGFFNNWNSGLDQFDAEALSMYLMNPQVENKALRDLSWLAYAKNGVVRNVVDYMAALPTLSRIVFSKSTKPDGSRPRQYSRNRVLFSRTLEKVRDREIIRDSILKNCNDGVSFYYLVTDPRPIKEKDIDPLVVATMTEINQADIEINAEPPNCTLLPLPVDYCKITGIRNNAYEISFDLFYFNKFIASGLKRKLSQYPKEIRDAWFKHNMSTGHRWLVLDNTKTIVTKIGSKRESCWGLPLTAAALSDILYYDYFTDTKRNMLDTINNRTVYQTFPAGKDAGTSALTGTQQEQQHNTVKNALHNRKPGQWGLSFFSLAAGTKLDVLNTQTDIFDSKNEDNLIERTAGDLGFGAPLLNGVSDGNYAVLKLNLELVSAQVLSWVKQFQTELNKVIHYNIVKDPACVMEVDYLPMTYVNKDDMIGHMKELYLQGRGSWQAWVASTGINFDSYIAMLDEEIERGLEQKYPVHLTSFTITDRDPPDDIDRAAVGRPRLVKDATNDNTLKSQANDGNSAPRANI